MSKVTRFLIEDEGGTLIEYAFLASLIGLAAIAGMQAVGQNLSVKLDEIATALS